MEIGKAWRLDVCQISELPKRASFDHDIDGLAQERHNSVANARGLRLSCTNPPIYETKIYWKKSEIKTSAILMHFVDNRIHKTASHNGDLPGQSK